VLIWCIGGCLAGAPHLTPAQTPVQTQTETTLTLPIVDGALPADLRRIKIHQGARLRWRISSNTAGELHLHAYRLSAKLQGGQTSEWAFTAHATGRFRLEWHGANDKSDAAGAHHAPPLAILEVRPD
jgi:hypothetical protein